MDHLCNALDLLKSLPVEEMTEENKTQIRTMMKELLAVEKKTLALEMLQSGQINSDPELSMQKNLTMMEEKLHELMLGDQIKSQLSDEIEELLNSLKTSQEASNSDDDIEIQVGTTLNKLDPISKKPIDNPVKNQKCGHVYDRDTITNFISGFSGKTRKQQKRISCPVLGCPNKTPIDPSHLKDYPEYFDLLKEEETKEPTTLNVQTIDNSTLD